MRTALAAMAPAARGMARKLPACRSRRPISRIRFHGRENLGKFLPGGDERPSTRYAVFQRLAERRGALGAG